MLWWWCFKGSKSMLGANKYIFFSAKVLMIEDIASIRKEYKISIHAHLVPSLTDILTKDFWASGHNWYIDGIQLSCFNIAIKLTCFKLWVWYWSSLSLPSADVGCHLTHLLLLIILFPMLLLLLLLGVHYCLYNNAALLSYSMSRVQSRREQQNQTGFSFQLRCVHWVAEFQAECSRVPSRAVSIRVDLECGAMPTTLGWNMLMLHLSQATTTNTSANTNLFDTHIVV